jgi:hypothetical protein
VLQRAAACCSARARARDAATARPVVRARAFRRPGVLGVLTGRRRRPAPPRRLNAARDGRPLPCSALPWLLPLRMLTAQASAFNSWRELATTVACVLEYATQTNEGTVGPYGFASAGGCRLRLFLYGWMGSRELLWPAVCRLGGRPRLSAV